MTADGVLSHDELLTLAHKVEAAAVDRDRGRVTAAANRLYDEVSTHLAAERAELARVPPREERLLERGRERVVDLLLDVALCAETGPDMSATCEHLAQQLVAQLQVQANRERIAGMALIGTPEYGEDG